jgi:hypothetical protein
LTILFKKLPGTPFPFGVGQIASSISCTGNSLGVRRH